MDIWNFFFVTSLRITLRVTKITVHNETTFLFFVTLSYHKDTKKMHFEETMLGEHVRSDDQQSADSFVPACYKLQH